MVKSKLRFYQTRFNESLGIVAEKPKEECQRSGLYQTRLNESLGIVKRKPRSSTANYPVRESRVYKKLSLGLFPHELDLGSAPYMEEHQLLNSPAYDANFARIECRVYKEYLQRLFPIPQEFEGQLSYRIRGYSCDFIAYYDVSILYNAYNLASSFVPNIEPPSRWDEIALSDLFCLRLNSAISNSG